VQVQVNPVCNAQFVRKLITNAELSSLQFELSYKPTHSIWQYTSHGHGCYAG